MCTLKISTSSSSALPAISLGLTILAEIFAYVTGFFVCVCVCVCFCFLFFNPTIEVVTLHLHGLIVSTFQIHLSHKVTEDVCNPV